MAFANEDLGRLRQSKVFFDLFEYYSLGLNNKDAPSLNTDMNQPMMLQMCPGYMNSLLNFSQTPYMGAFAVPNGLWQHPWGYGATPNVETGVRGSHSAHCDEGEITLITLNDDSDGQDHMPVDSADSNDDSENEIDPETVIVAEDYEAETRSMDGFDKYVDDRAVFNVEMDGADCNQPMAPSDFDPEDVQDNFLSAQMPGPWRHEYVEVTGAEPLGVNSTKPFTEVDELSAYVDSTPLPNDSDLEREGK